MKNAQRAAGRLWYFVAEKKLFFGTILVPLVRTEISHPSRLSTGGVGKGCNSNRQHHLATKTSKHPSSSQSTVEHKYEHIQTIFYPSNRDSSRSTEPDLPTICSTSEQQPSDSQELISTSTAIQYEQQRRISNEGGLKPKWSLFSSWRRCSPTSPSS